MEKPTVEHLVAVKHILRYVAGTRTMGCFMARGTLTDEHLVGYSDSGHAGDLHERKSTSGVLFFLGSSPVICSPRNKR
jgi:hypothetical protein